MNSLIAMTAILLASYSAPNITASEEPCALCSSFTEIGPVQVNRYIKYKIDYDSLESRSLIAEETGKYYAIVISYSSLKYALIQTRHLIDHGYQNAGILKINDRYSVYIQSGQAEFDDELITATGQWMQECGTSQVYIRKY